MFWQTSRRKIRLGRTLVMGILNTTPDSFSDGGRFVSVDAAIIQAEKMIAAGADIIDIGGESTRPGSDRVEAAVEIERTVPVIKAICERFDVPVSIDTTKSEVAAAAVGAGAELINDISGLRHDPQLADLAVKNGAGIILMHSIGDFETMHSKPPVNDIIEHVINDLGRAVNLAESRGVRRDQIALDVGIGFGKTVPQNLELLAKLDKIISEFPDLPMLVGTSRKSFIGKLLGGTDTASRLSGSLASISAAAWNGANMVRVHDVKESVEAVRIVDAIKEQL